MTPLLVAMLALVPVLRPEVTSSPEGRALADQLARLETVMSSAALAALVSGPEDEIADYVPSLLRYRQARDSAFRRSAFGETLAARGVTDPDVVWGVLFALRRWHRSEPVTLDLVAAAARGPHRRARVRGEWLEIVDHVRFDRNAAAPASGQAELLDAIGATLVGNPGLALLELRGHAGPDERGGDDLARRRAMAVRDQLVRRGVDGGRLVPAAAPRAPGTPSRKGETRAYVELLNIREISGR